MPRPRALLLLLTTLTLGAAIAGAACGPAAETPPACPNLLPAACPSPEPTFAADAGPIIAARCAGPCHAPGGVEANRPFQTYQQIFDQRVSILTQVHACKMPLAGATPLSDDEKIRLLGWLKCMAKNN